MAYANLTKAVAVTLGVLVMVVLISFVVSAWTEPSLPPPAGNVSAPLNVSTTTQYKGGALGIGGLFQTDKDTHLAIISGNVGIGTTSPGQKLTVAGTIESTSGGFKFPDGSVQTKAAGTNFFRTDNPQNTVNIGGTTYTIAWSNDSQVNVISGTYTKVKEIKLNAAPSSTLRTAVDLLITYRGGRLEQIYLGTGV